MQMQDCAQRINHTKTQNCYYKSLEYFEDLDIWCYSLFIINRIKGHSNV